MDTQSEKAALPTYKAALPTDKAIDPLRRVFVPKEFEIKGVTLFRTLDKQCYYRDKNGCIRRLRRDGHN